MIVLLLLFSIFATLHHSANKVLQFAICCHFHVRGIKTEFDVIVSNVGDKKIQVIKVVRAITGLGLKEAKAVVDGIPGPVKEGVPKEEAESIKAQLEEAGASVEIK